jgi:secreted trypsin-like serine protease
VVWIESSRGGLCSGALIAPDLVLTAAHCVLSRGDYRVVVVDRAFRRHALPAVAAALHPAFVPGTTPRNQPGIDLAVLRLAQSLGGDFVPFDIRSGSATVPGEQVAVAGFGVARDGSSGTARTLRAARLVSLGTMEFANRVLVVADAERLATRPGAGACLGDSGGPVLRLGFGGAELVGIVSWASGPLASRGASACGGFTAVTPVAEHASWIVARAADLRRLSVAAPRLARGNRADWLAR